MRMLTGFLALVPLFAFAQTPSVEAQLQALLSEEWHRVHPPPPSGTIIVFPPPFWFVSKVFYEPVLLERQGIKLSAIPDSVAVKTYLQRNCSSSEQRVKEKLKLEYTVGTKWELTKTVKSDSSASMTLTYPKEILSVTAKNDMTVDTKTVQSVDTTKITTEEQDFDVLVPPYTARLFMLERSLSNGMFEFKGVVVADSQVVLRKPNGEESPSLGLLSATIPRAKRTFPLEGRFLNVSAEKKTFTYIDKSLDKDSEADCPKFDVSTGDIAGSASSATQLARISSSSATIVPLVSGMTITTADVVGNVEVRAKSLGPGFCGVKISGGGRNIGIAAPPAAWSSWFNLVSHMNKSIFKVEGEIICDTGALMEVRYQK